MEQSPYVTATKIGRGALNQALAPLLQLIGADIGAVLTDPPMLIGADFVEVHVVATGEEVEAGEGLVEVGDDEGAIWGRAIRVEVDLNDWAGWDWPPRADYPGMTQVQR